MDLLDFVSNLFLLDTKDEQENIKPPRILSLFYLLLILGIIWIIAEVKSIVNLQSPILFLLLFGIVGIVLSFTVMYFLWRTGLIEFFTKQFAIIILVPVLLLTIASASSINASKGEDGRLGFDLLRKP